MRRVFEDFTTPSTSSTTMRFDLCIYLGKMYSYARSVSGCRDIFRAKIVLVRLRDVCFALSGIWKIGCEALFYTTKGPNTFSEMRAPFRRSQRGAKLFGLRGRRRKQRDRVALAVGAAGVNTSIDTSAGPRVGIDKSGAAEGQARQERHKRCGRGAG